MKVSRPVFVRSFERTGEGSKGRSLRRKDQCKPCRVFGVAHSLTRMLRFAQERRNFFLSLAPPPPHLPSRTKERRNGSWRLDFFLRLPLLFAPLSVPIRIKPLRDDEVSLPQDLEFHSPAANSTSMAGQNQKTNDDGTRNGSSRALCSLCSK